VLREVCGGFEVEAREPALFSGEIGLERFAGIECASIAGSPSRIVRDSATAGAEGAGLLFYVLQLEGTSRMRQGEREAALRPGDATLIDGGRSSEFLYEGFSRQLSLHLPARVVAAHGSGWSGKLATVVAGRGYAGALHALLASSASAAARFSGAEAALLRTQLIEGITLLVNAQDEPCPGAIQGPQCEWTRVQGLLRRQLSNPDLDCGAAARSACVSVRQLQRLFQSQGLTFGAWLRRERLERCYFDLRQASGTRATVTEVALRWGFGDLSYFSRAFSAHFGLSPRAARRLPSPVGSQGQGSGACGRAPARRP
jgi:AraC family transcriptional activator of tynA and feaB